MFGHDAIGQALTDHGIDTMFGVLGDGNLFMAESMMRTAAMRYVAATHEANAVLMAEGWARATGRLGVATITHGPGITNAVTALVEGCRNRTPMLIAAGDTPRDDRFHLQNIDQATLIKSTGAGFQPIHAVSTIAADVAAAVRRAHAERRPIVLNMPLDISRAADVALGDVPILASSRQATAPDPAALDVAVGLIASANRPIVLAGRGAVHADAHDALVALANALGAPVATTILGSSYFADDEANLGIFGTLSHAVAQEAIASADCVISFGASLNKYTTDEGRLLHGKRVVQCDLDPARLGSTVPIDAGVVGDAARVAETITEWLGSIDHQPSAFRSSELKAELAAFAPAAGYADQSRPGFIDPRTFTIGMDALLPDDRTVVIDAGRFMLWALTLPVPDPTALITSHGFASIGLGMSNAIGAAVGRPNRPTVLALGDGGFMMGGMAEFHTAVEHNLDLIVLLYNDGSYGAEHIQLYRKDMDTKASLHHWPDFAPVMEALGANTVVVSGPDDFDNVSAAVANRQPGRPLFIEARLDPDMVSAITTGH